MTIDLRKCPKDTPQIVWGPDGRRYYVTSELQFDYIRYEIARHRDNGWKIAYDNSYIPIGPDGMIDEPSGGFFPTREYFISYILENGIFEEQHDLREELIDKDVEYEDTGIR